VILVVSHAADDHAVAVLGALERLGHPAVLLDTASFPVRSSLTQRFEDGVARWDLTTAGRSIDLGTCGAGWWRRPQPFVLDASLAPQVAEFTYAECYEAVAGLWAALDLAWVNPPPEDESAHHKPYQLAVAGRVGLRTPRTVITNDPEVARRFVAENGPGNTVYKTFLASQQHWRETRIVQPDELAVLERVRLAPVIFQRRVPATADIRVTVVGDRMFPVAVTTPPGGYSVDYRVDMDAACFRPTTLSPEVEHGLRALMRVLGLVYGAIDLRRTPSGEDVFLEVNPAGEWRFVEDRTGLPITEAVAELLARLDRGREDAPHDRGSTSRRRSDAA
jgi:glutathione synthase/RimK-type ligase-like ATP-grasp enzyme